MVPELFQGEAYCVKCKDKRPMQNAWIRVSDSGRRMAQGECPVCGTKMNRILGNVAPDGLSAEQIPVTTEAAEPRSTEDSYGTVTLGAMSNLSALYEKAYPIGWLSEFGGAIGDSEWVSGPQPETRTGYERLRDWFWTKMHDSSNTRGYCNEGGCCCSC